MRIAQILNGAAHWIFEADEMPVWPPGPDGKAMVLMDITAFPDVSEGWLYDEETGGFAEPLAEEGPPPSQGQPVPGMSVEELILIQMCAQAEAYEAQQAAAAEQKEMALITMDAVATLFEAITEGV